MAKRKKKVSVGMSAEDALLSVLKDSEEKAPIIVRVGRPRSFNSPEDFAEQVSDYFTYSANTPYHLPNFAGLAYHLAVSRETLYEYGSKPEYSDTMKEARSLIENAWVQRLGRQQPVGAIFYLKNAFRDHYKDTPGEYGNGTTNNIFLLPRAIAERHGLNVPELPAGQEQKPVVLDADTIEVEVTASPA